MTEVIAVSHQKGGVGKTTTTVMLGFAFAQQQLETVLIDADTRTQGTSQWLTRIQADMPLDEELPFWFGQWHRAEGEPLPSFVRRMVANARPSTVDVVVIDMGPDDAESVRTLMPIVTRVITPVAPEQAELIRLPNMRSLVDARVPMDVLLRRVDSVGQGASAMARRDMEAAGYRVLTTEIPRSRTLYADPFGMVPPTLGAYATLAVELTGRAL